MAILRITVAWIGRSAWWVICHTDALIRKAGAIAGLFSSS